MPVRTKRVYDPPAPEDGTRMLVMRLYPPRATQASDSAAAAPQDQKRLTKPEKRETVLMLELA